MNNNPFKKNFRFGLGVFFTVLEGILSANLNEKLNSGFGPNARVNSI